MMTSLSLRFATLCLGVTAIALLAGCSKNLSTSAGDQTLAPGPPPPKVAEVPPPSPPEPAPPEKVTPPKQAEVAIRPPAAPEEPRVTEPPLVAAPAPTEAAPAPEVKDFGPPEALPEARVVEPEAPSLVASAAPTEAAPAPVTEPPLVATPAPTEATPAPTPAPVSKLAGLADVYYDYNKAAIRNDGKAVLEQDARLLKAENGWKLLISGHCDERGTLAYNLVLGERRAQSAMRYLGDLGVPVAQIQVTSYGKEKPFCTDHNKDCWQKNRRAHLALR